MPDRDVKTIRDVINFQYAKIITRSAFKLNNGGEAKKECYGFVKKTFNDLKTGKIEWSAILREDWQSVELENECAYCGGKTGLAHEHIVPKSFLINERCPKCDTIQGIHNQVWACKKCNSEKGTMGLYTFYKKKLNGEKKFYDFLPSLVEKKYLKTIFCCFENCAQCLDCGDLDGDGEMTVLDIDYALKKHGRL